MLSCCWSFASSRARTPCARAMSAAKCALRIAKDFEELIAWATANGNQASIDEDAFAKEGIHRLFVTIDGPADTPYAGAKFQLCCELLPTFPFKSPSIAFKTPIWHPNVDADGGAVCLDVIGADRWSGVTTLCTVFSIYIPALLQCPNHESPLNAEAATQLAEDAAAYATIVAAHTAKHAKSGAAAARAPPS